MKNLSKQKPKGIAVLKLLHLAAHSRRGLKRHGSDSTPEETETLSFYTKNIKPIWNKFCFCFCFTQMPPRQYKELLSRKDSIKTMSKFFTLHPINSQGLYLPATIIYLTTANRLPIFHCKYNGISRQKAHSSIHKYWAKLTSHGYTLRRHELELVKFITPTYYQT